MFKIHFALRDWIYSLIIGFLVVSYWRSTWTLLDVLGCNQPSSATLANGDSFCFALPAAEAPEGEFGRLRLKNATFSYAAGLAMLFIGVTMMCYGLWLPDSRTLKVTTHLRLLRFFIVYILGGSAVNIWRGIWYWADFWILPNNPLASYWTTSLVGAGAAFTVFCGNSLLAPPAIFLLDGPDTDPPPIAVTALGSHFSSTLPSGQKHPQMPTYVYLLDILLSFGFVPFAVVWFWRGSWLLLDYYFWGFTSSDRDVQVSILWSMVMFGVCISLASEPIVGILDSRLGGNRKFLLGMLGRFRTYILAWGTVSLWRCFWLCWDEFLGGTTLLSAGLGHVLSLILLTAMGCVSSINAPASTMGVDSIPHPECDDEPLFSMVPLPWETLHAFGLFRQVDKDKVDESKRSFTTTSNTAVFAARQIEMIIREDDDDDNDDDDSPQDPTASQRKVTPPNAIMEQSWNPLDPSESRDDEMIQGKSPSKHPSMRHSFPSWRPGLLGTERSWRPGLVRSDATSFLDLEKPTLRLQRCSDYAQRPNEDNKRRRSVFFRSR